MDRSDASALADLQMHWDEAYTIGLDGDIWLARFHGSADELRAHTSSELRELIRADYAYRRQVHRVRPAGDEAPVAGGGLEDDDDYGAHFDGAHSDGTRSDGAHSCAHSDGAKSDSAHSDVGYANIRGERMST